MWRLRRHFTTRRAVVLIIVVGVLVEVPLLLHFVNRPGTAGVPVAQSAAVPSSIGNLNPHPIAGKFKPDKIKISDCTDQTCFEQGFGNIAYYDGPKAAIALAARKYNEGADPSCHRVMHVIGAAALARFKGNIAETFAAGSSFCWSGYYHGVLERAFMDVKSYDAKTLGAKARTICASRAIHAESWLAYQCLHGLGHGLMITTAYDLPLALRVCNRLATPWDQTSCKGGVFMENILTSYGGLSPWVRANDPIFPCNRVAERDKYTCYQQVTTRMIRMFGTNWKKMAALCSRVESRWVSTCFGSFGQNASVLALRNPRKTAKTCAITAPYGGEATCIRYAAEDIAGTYSNGKQASALCDIASKGVRGGCYEAIGSLLRYIKTTPAARKSACGAITEVRTYIADCMHGMTKRASIPGLNRSAR
jgi:hypothetical protein